MTIRWTRKAIPPLRSLHDYISLDNSRAADDTVDILLNGIETLQQHPELG